MALADFLGLRYHWYCLSFALFLPHGEYLPWVESNMPINMRQCQKYIKLFKENPKLLSNAHSSAHLDINSELKLFSTQSFSSGLFAYFIFFNLNKLVNIISTQYLKVFIKLWCISCFKIPTNVIS